MKEKIQEKSDALQKIINTINQGKQQITQLEQEALMLQGELRLLNEMDKPNTILKQGDVGTVFCTDKPKEKK